jgi:hypothetical protein
MNSLRTLLCFLSIFFGCCLASSVAWATDEQAAFPKSIALKKKGKLLEFFPDNTCHGFSASDKVSAATLKDFAFLYLYFFSDYYALPEWRSTEEASSTAERVLFETLRTANARRKVFANRLVVFFST